MKRRLKKHAFTMIELVMALIVASIILAAVATLASATTAADEATNKMGRQQSQLRQVSMQLTDLIRRANRVTAATDNGFILWHDNNVDGSTTADELTGVRRESDGNTLKIGTDRSYCQFKNIRFVYDGAAPATRFITISFDIRENGEIQQCRIDAHLRASAKHRKL